MRPKSFHIASILCLTFFVTSCDKGYQVRFTNYYIEPMDSVAISGSKIVFKNVGLQETTEYFKIDKGNYPVIFYTVSKQEISSSITIPDKGTGLYNIQIDGIKQVSLLKE